jgi:hypothetical protein
MGSVPHPPIKRYALVPKAGDDGIRRFRLARVRSGAPAAPERLERMEEIALADLDVFSPRRPRAGDDHDR